MITVDSQFPFVAVVSLARRADRWQQCQDELYRHGIMSAIRWPAVDGVLRWPDAPPSNRSVFGCRASHTELLRHFIETGFPEMLVLEDDFKIRHDDFEQRFDTAMRQVPDDWDLLYLGGQYQEPPIREVNACVIRSRGVLTTSSYAIKRGLARLMLDCDPTEYGINTLCAEGRVHSIGGAIDSIYCGLSRRFVSYVLRPRLMVQRAGFSEIQQFVNEHPEFSMEAQHEDWNLGYTL